ncbi:MAG: hypothetical protein ACE5J5_03705 [Candidatus Hydrothermarchaeales archaeon]
MSINIGVANSILAVIISFGFIGGGIKFIDEAFDEDIFNKRFATVLAPILVVLWICISIFDKVSAVILFSILFGVLLTGKIDNVVFKISTISLIVFFALRGLFGSYLIPLLFLTFMGIVDEKGNDYVDNNSTNRVVEFFFLHRFSMKMGVILLCLTSYFSWIYLVAFLCFDIAYDSVGLVSQNIASKKERVYVFFCNDLPHGLPKDRIILLNNQSLNFEDAIFSLNL